jgi:hypothetical protein
MQPTWAVLVVALLGVAGTLGAAMFSQIWSARREDRRWQQEQQAEQQRWQRQQQERREQWRREDLLHAGQRREDAYAHFLLAAAKWASTAYTLKAKADQATDRLNTDDLDRITALTEQAEAACVPLLLHGSREARTAADDVCQVMITFIDALSAEPLAKQLLDQAVVEFKRTSDIALEHMRSELGQPSTRPRPDGAG